MTQNAASKSVRSGSTRLISENLNQNKVGFRYTISDKLISTRPNLGGFKLISFQGYEPVRSLKFAPWIKCEVLSIQNERRTILITEACQKKTLEPQAQLNVLSRLHFHSSSW